MLAAVALLFFRNVQNDAIELRHSLDLAGQSAVWATFRCDTIEQFVLYVGHGRNVLHPLFVDIDMASAAHCCATTLSNDALNPLRDCRLHTRRALLDFESLGIVGGRYKGNFVLFVRPYRMLKGRFNMARKLLCPAFDRITIVNSLELTRVDFRSDPQLTHVI